MPLDGFKSSLALTTLIRGLVQSYLVCDVVNHVLMHMEAFRSCLQLLVVHHLHHMFARNDLIVGLIWIFDQTARFARLQSNRVHTVIEHIESDLGAASRRIRACVVL